MKKQSKSGRKRILIGERFNYLTPIEVIGLTNNGTRIYKCQCRCGNVTTANTNSLKQGVIKSCGCRNREVIDSKPFKTHGMTKTRFYKIWSDMIYRCNKPRATNYYNYGGKGIRVCDRWLQFENFYDDMFEGYADHLTIDRIDPNGNYSPSNCRWATYQEQAENKKNTIFITIDGETKKLSEWSSVSGVSSRLIRFRIKTLGWTDMKKAVFKPSTKKTVP